MPPEDSLEDETYCPGARPGLGQLRHVVGETPVEREEGAEGLDDARAHCHGQQPTGIPALAKKLNSAPANC